MHDIAPKTSLRFQCPDRPSTDGVIRVDNYWCHSAIISTRPTGPTASNAKHTAAAVDSNAPVQEVAKPSPGSGPASPAPPDSSSSGSSSTSPKGHEKKPSRAKKFDPRARLNEIKRNANMKGGSAFAAKLRSQAREALLASRTSFTNFQDARKDLIEKKKEESAKAVDVSPCIQLAVDLPGMSFITLFCDDQKVKDAANYFLKDIPFDCELIDPLLIIVLI